MEKGIGNEWIPPQGPQGNQARVENLTVEEFKNTIKIITQAITAEAQAVTTQAQVVTTQANRDVEPRVCNIPENYMSREEPNRSLRMCIGDR